MEKGNLISQYLRLHAYIHNILCGERFILFIWSINHIVSSILFTGLGILLKYILSLIINTSIYNQCFYEKINY
jgi:hypothetical protein